MKERGMRKEQETNTSTFQYCTSGIRELLFGNSALFIHTVAALLRKCLFFAVQFVDVCRFSGPFLEAQRRGVFLSFAQSGY